MTVAMFALREPPPRDEQPMMAATAIAAIAIATIALHTVRGVLILLSIGLPFCFGLGGDRLCESSHERTPDPWHKGCVTLSPSVA